MMRSVLVVALLVGFAGSASAGPIAVFTQVREANHSGSDECYLSGYGSSLAVLTTGGGVSPIITVPGDQNSGAQFVTGFWPVIGFKNYAQYEAALETPLTIPETPVTLYAEVWNGEYGATSDVRQVYIDAVISGTFGAGPGQNYLDWQFITPPVQIDFGATVVTLSYTPVHMPDGVPSIGFEDGSPPIGFPPGSADRYYPTLLEAHIDVQRDPSDPPIVQPPSDVPGVPEPTSALLLAGFAAGGFLTRLRTPRK